MAGEAHSVVGYDRLKCDVTALTDSRDGRDVILLLNFNLPKRVLDDGEGELPRRLEEIVAFVTGNFGDQPPGHLLPNVGHLLAEAPDQRHPHRTRLFQV